MGQGSSAEPSGSLPSWPEELPLMPRATKARGSGQDETTWKIFLDCITLSCDLTEGPVSSSLCLLLGIRPKVIFSPRLWKALHPSPQDLSLF